MGTTAEAGEPSRSATRRGFVATAAGVAGAQLLGAAWPGATSTASAGTRKHCVPRPPGIRRSSLAISHDGRSVWTADTGATTITAHRARDLARSHAIDVGDAPLDIALTPDGQRALVTTGFYDRPGLAIVDLAVGKVVRRVDVGKSAGAVTLAADGRAAYVVAGGTQGRLLRVDPRTGAVEATVDVGRDPRGLALTHDGRHALVALNGDAAVAVVALAKHQVDDRIATAPFPYLIAAAPHGRRAFVSHNGYGETRISVLDVHAHRALGRITVGLDPAGLAFASPSTLLVAARGAGTVSVLSARSGRRLRRVVTDGFPRAIAVRGRRAIVLDEQTGQLRAVRV